MYTKGIKTVRGCIVAVHDSIDHQLCYGSGLSHYLDFNLDFTGTVEWAG